MDKSLLGLDLQQLTEIVESWGEAAYRGRQLFEAIYGQRRNSLEQISTLPKGLRERLATDGVEIGLPQVEKRYLSSDGTVRYLMTFADGQSVETVWMPDGDDGEAGDGSDAGLVADSEPASSPRKWSRATICVSSQIGCAVNCQFCLTALLGQKRNLSAGEIVGQILVVLNDHAVDMERDRVNIVFMGQGEPFLNFDAFMQAVKLLVSGVGFSTQRMTVSTSGIVPRIEDLGREAVRPKLAISLNAPNDAIREQIMPINRKWNLAKILDAVRGFPLRGRERITFEYVLLGGVTDRPKHARELAKLVRGLPCKINLIAWNPGPEVPFTTPDDGAVERFQEILIQSGIPAFIRRPRGRDIYAACGQLKKMTELVTLGA